MKGSLFATLQGALGAMAYEKYAYFERHGKPGGCHSLDGCGKVGKGNWVPDPSTIVFPADHYRHGNSWDLCVGSHHCGPKDTLGKVNFGFKDDALVFDFERIDRYKYEDVVIHIQREGPPTDQSPVYSIAGGQCIPQKDCKEVKCHIPYFSLTDGGGNKEMCPIDGRGSWVFYIQIEVIISHGHKKYELYNRGAKHDVCWFDLSYCCAECPDCKPDCHGHHCHNRPKQLEYKRDGTWDGDYHDECCHETYYHRHHHDHLHHHKRPCCRKKNYPLGGYNVATDEQDHINESSETKLEEVHDIKLEDHDTNTEIHDTTKLETENTKPVTEDTKLETENTKPVTEDTKLETENTKPATEDTKLEIENTKPATEDTKLETENTKPATENTKSETKNTKPVTENTKPKIAARKEERDHFYHGHKKDCAGVLLAAWGADGSSARPMAELAHHSHPNTCLNHPGYYLQYSQADLEATVSGLIGHDHDVYGNFFIELDKSRHETEILVAVEVEDKHKHVVTEIAVFIGCDGGCDSHERPNICLPETYETVAVEEKGFGNLELAIKDTFNCHGDYFIAIFVEICHVHDRGNCHKCKVHI